MEIISKLCTRSQPTSPPPVIENWQIVYHQLARGKKQQRCKAPNLTTKSGFCGNQTRYYCSETKYNAVPLCSNTDCSLKYHNKGCMIIK